MKVLAIDPGTTRCGLAVSDELGILATPIAPLEVGEGATLAERLAQRAREVGANLILLGHPVQMDGTPGPRARAVERLAHRLRQVCDIPVDLVDERLTSIEAAARLRETGRSRCRTGLHSAAAAVLLQAWLDARRQRTR